MKLFLRIAQKIKKFFSAEPSRYYSDWIGKEGETYRKGVYERQKQGGTKPLIDNPTIEEISKEIRFFCPTSVLELGCGWGRLMEPLNSDFNIEGCDICKDLMEKANPSLRIFSWDIVKTKCPKNNQNWDVLFSRGLFLYIFQNSNDLRDSIKNVLEVTNKAIILWEWPHVLEAIKKISTDSKLQFRPIEYRDE